jgi:hypothetical protein
MPQRVSHIRHRVLTNPFSQAVLTFIHDILAPRDSPDTEFYIRALTLQFSQFIDTAEMKGLGHADIHAPRMATTQIAFGGHALHAIKLNAAKGTGHHAHATADTPVFVNHHGMRQGITAQGSIWTHFHAHGHLTLPARDGKYASQVQVDMDKDIGSMALLGLFLMK